MMFAGNNQACGDACGRRKGHVGAFIGNDADDGKLVITLRQ